jgi:hypothetical protein
MVARAAASDNGRLSDAGDPMSRAGIVQGADIPREAGDDAGGGGDGAAGDTRGLNRFASSSANPIRQPGEVLHVRCSLALEHLPACDDVMLRGLPRRRIVLTANHAEMVITMGYG